MSGVDVREFTVSISGYRETARVRKIHSGTTMGELWRVEFSETLLPLAKSMDLPGVLDFTKASSRAIGLLQTRAELYKKMLDIEKQWREKVGEMKQLGSEDRHG